MGWWSNKGKKDKKKKPKKKKRNVGEKKIKTTKRNAGTVGQYKEKKTSKKQKQDKKNEKTSKSIHVPKLREGSRQDNLCQLPSKARKVTGEGGIPGVIRRVLRMGAATAGPP